MQSEMCTSGCLQARQRAELSATDAEDKLKAYVWSVDPRNGDGSQAEGARAKAMADLDASLMQRLDEDSATNHKLLETLKVAQVTATLASPSILVPHVLMIDMTCGACR